MADPVLFKVTNDNGFNFRTSILRDGYHLSKSATFNSIPIMGRSSPILTFSYSNSIQLAVELELMAGLLADPDAKREVSDVIKGFMSLLFPVDPGTKPPAKCKVTCGAELKNWECLCTNVQVHGGNNNMWRPDGTPMSGQLQVEFVGIEINNVSATDWGNSGLNFDQLAIRY